MSVDNLQRMYLVMADDRPLVLYEYEHEARAAIERLKLHYPGTHKDTVYTMETVAYVPARRHRKE